MKRSCREFLKKVSRSGLALASAALLTFSLTACGSAGEETAAEPEETAEEPEEAAGEAADAGEEDSEVYEEALECYEMIMETEEDARYDMFTQAQSSLNYDENNTRYFVDPDTAATLPEELNETVLSLGDYEIGLSEKTDYGWFIVMRLPFSDEELAQIRSDTAAALFDEQLEEASSAAAVVETEALDELDFTAYLDALSKLQAQITDTYSESAAAGEDTETAETQVMAALPEAAKEDCVSYLTEGALQKDTPVMTINEEPVDAETLFYFLNYEKNSQLGNGEVTDAYLVTLLNLAKKDAVRYTMAGQLAEENGLSLTEEETAEIQDILDNTLESTLLYMGCNKSALKTILTDTYLGNACADHLYGENGTIGLTEDEVNTYAADNGYYSCLYIWFYETT